MLPLRLPRPEGARKSSLNTRVIQINAQRGVFRNLTEEALVAEIALQSSGGQDVAMQDEAAGERQKPESKQEVIYKGREEILQQIEYIKIYNLSHLEADHCQVVQEMRHSWLWTSSHFFSRKAR